MHGLGHSLNLKWPTCLTCLRRHTSMSSFSALFVIAGVCLVCVRASAIAHCAPPALANPSVTPDLGGCLQLFDNPALRVSHGTNATHVALLFEAHLGTPNNTAGRRMWWAMALQAKQGGAMMDKDVVAFVADSTPGDGALFAYDMHSFGYQRPSLDVSHGGRQDVHLVAEESFADGSLLPGAGSTPAQAAWAVWDGVDGQVAQNGCGRRE